MGCLYYLIVWPLYFYYYLFKFFIYAIYYTFLISYYACVFVFRLIINIIAMIIGFTSSNNQNNYNSHTTYYNTSNKKNKKIKEASWKEKNFEKESKLWGLSNEDKRIAKQERMSPADYIEAEEYDDDELLKDDWDR